MDTLKVLNIGDVVICKRKLYHNGITLFIKGNTYTIEAVDGSGDGTRVTITGEANNTIKIHTFIALTYLEKIRQSRKDRIQNLGL